ncbi:hypothetical protein JM93_01564 [Roseibium hamelinense]|uniref:Uncharacterized protein n=1 Tax=Roseibium hamelinense TaxID=150831 RepID=A0A562T741_9HYPH|nr:hypothetical protein JM93_01564 [Roseibium hamelinense]
MPVARRWTCGLSPLGRPVSGQAASPVAASHEARSSRVDCALNNPFWARFRKGLRGRVSIKTDRLRCGRRFCPDRDRQWPVLPDRAAGPPACPRPGGRSGSVSYAILTKYSDRRIFNDDAPGARDGVRTWLRQPRFSGRSCSGRPSSSRSCSRGCRGCRPKAHPVSAT